MDDLVIMEDLESSQDIVGDLPNEILGEFMAFLSLPLDETLDKIRNTARSPPSANSIRMQRVEPNS